MTRPQPTALDAALGDIEQAQRWLAETIHEQQEARQELSRRITDARTIGATMQQIADALGMKRPNVYRLLETRKEPT